MQTRNKITILHSLSHTHKVHNLNKIFMVKLFEIKKKLNSNTKNTINIESLQMLKKITKIFFSSSQNR